MYLISIYFDVKTESIMQSLMNQVAKITGNTFMLDGNIPPHITLLAFDTQNEKKAVELLEENVSIFKSFELFFAAVGAFKGQVVYVEPVLNEYLNNMSFELYDIYKELDDIRFSPYYQPFQWLPHMSVAKHLEQNQMVEAFEVLMKNFVPMNGMVTRIGIAKTNPHRDIKVYEI